MRDPGGGRGHRGLDSGWKRRRCCVGCSCDCLVGVTTGNTREGQAVGAESHFHLRATSAYGKVQLAAKTNEPCFRGSVEVEGPQW